MHRGILKRAGCVLLIAVLCFNLTAPASAYTVSTSSGIKTLFYHTAQQFENAWDYFFEHGSLTDELINAVRSKFVDFSTTSDADYVGYSMYEVNAWAKDVDRQGYNLAQFMHWTYVPGTGYYIYSFQSEPLSFATRFGESEERVRDFINLIGIDGLAFHTGGFGSYPLASPFMIGGSFEGGGGASRGDVVGSAGTPHDYYVDQSDTETTINSNNQTTNTTIYNGGDTYTTETFDYSNGTWYDNVTGTVNDIESLYYSPVDQTYTVNNTYNITYEYNYTYYYNLGSSENLVQDYKFYYELPDGRSSSDLTADEISGLSLQFDVVNYAEDRTDENTKILVPFDGSWENTAYQGADLTWITGASVTYKESAAFNGALYLPGDARSTFYFPFAVPSSSLFSQGMTVQFRYYCDALSGSSASFANFAFTPFEFTTSGRPSPLFYFYRDQIIFDTTANLSSFTLGQGVTYGSLSSGVWNDITLSVVPISSNRLRYLLFVNGVNVISYNFNIPSGYGLNSNGLTPEFYFNFSGFDGHFHSTGSPSGLPYQMIDNLRVVDFALYDSSASFEPSPVPFDTNLVYVLPDTAGLQDNTIAVQSGIPVSGYRIGGVRPTFPDVGMVWMPLDGNKIADCQIYRGNYWESVGCRVWTGERWVPAWAFDVITLSDLWDIYGGEETDNYTEITPGSFFQWFQQHFLEFKTSVIERLDRILQALGIQTDDTDVTEPDADGNSNFTFFQFFDNLFSTQQKEESGVVADALGDLLDLAKRFVHSIAAFFSGFAVMDGLGSDYLQAASDALSGVSDLVSGVWLAIPSEIQDVTVACFMFVVFGALVAIFV